jgi:hypothetical protein
MSATDAKTLSERLHELHDRWSVAFQARDWQTCAIVNEQINALRAEAWRPLPEATQRALEELFDQ